MSKWNDSLRRAALYARQSKADPDGIDRQLPRLRKLVADRGWLIAGEYVDDGMSASKSRGPGSAWARMLADADAGKVDTVVAVDLDRLLRGLQDLLVLIEHDLMAVTTNGEIDLTTADGEFRATILAAVARFEVRRKAERQSRAQLQRAQQGRAPKGVRPLGYATNGDIIEDEAAVVHELFRLFAIQDGPSIASIAKGLSGQVGETSPPRCRTCRSAAGRWRSSVTSDVSALARILSRYPRTGLGTPRQSLGSCATPGTPATPSTRTATLVPRTSVAVGTPRSCVMRMAIP